MSIKHYHTINDQLTGLLHHSETLRNFLSYTDAPQTAHATKLVGIAEQNIEQIKNLNRKLSSRTINKSGIEHAIREMCEYLEEIVGTRFAISIDNRSPEISSRFSQPIYRIIHEAVTNALRHGKASLIDIQLEMSSETISLKVINDGLPFPERITEGVGLRLIRQRAKLLNATIAYARTSSGQTIFTCISNPDIHVEL